MDRKSAVSEYLSKRQAYLKAARSYAYAFNRFSDGDCSELELARAEQALDRAVLAVVEAGKAADRELGGEGQEGTPSAPAFTR